MTITFNCTDFMKRNCPAPVHVDGTARPKLIREEANTSFYRIVREYYQLSGIPAVINTSFNMHEGANSEFSDRCDPSIPPGKS